jgi:hypothetical protein
MILRFHKGLGTADTFTCIRADGSRLDETLPPGCVQHDLAHFAVESTLGYRDGVWGMLARGHRIDDYGQAQEAHGITLSPESYHAEYLSTLVQSAVYTGEISPAYHDMLRNAAEASGLPFPELPAPDRLSACIACARDLHMRWLTLPPDSSLELEFPG